MSVLNFKNKNPRTIEKVEEIVADQLSKFYSNYPWIVEYNKAIDYFEIYNGLVSMEYGMLTKKLSDYSTSSEFEKDLMMLGGQLLERANLPRIAKELDVEIWLATMERKLGVGQTLIGLETSK